MAKATAPTLRTVNAPSFGNPTELIGKTLELDPNDIAVSMNVRRNDITNESVQELARSLRGRQLQDIGVRPNLNGDGKVRFVLNFGHRRLKAAQLIRNGDKQLNIKANEKFRIRATVFANEGEGKNAAKTDQIEALASAYKENDERQQMSALDQTATYRRFRDLGESGPDTRRRMGISTAWENTLQQLEKISDRVRVALEDGTMDAKTAALTASLDEPAVGRVFDAMEKAARTRAALIKDAPTGEKASAAAKAKADKEAKAEQKRVAKLEAQAEKAKKKAEAAKKGETSRGPKVKALRSSVSIANHFASLIADKQVPQKIRDFAGVMREYIHQRCQEVKLNGALIALAGLSTADVSMPIPDNSAKGKGGTKTAPAPKAPKQTVSA